MSGDAGRGLWKEYLGAVVAVVVTAAVCLPLRSELQITDIAMLLLLSVVVSAARWHRGPALAATVLAIVVFDFGFVPPYYTFAVANKAYLLTFIVMLVVALVMGRLTARIREQAEDAREREQRATAGYALTRELTETSSPEGKVAVLRRHLAASFGSDDAVVILTEPGVEPRWPRDGIFAGADVRVAAAWAFEQGREAGAGTGDCAEVDACIVPLRTPSRLLGVAVVRPHGPHPPDESHWRTAIEMAQQGAAALERAELALGHESARIEVEAERLRTALLSSLSHDLRTPLATIEGSASSLLQDRHALTDSARAELAETIVHESHRMTRLVGNLLDMVRVETGGLAVQKSWQPLEEALGVALLRLEEQLKSHPIVVSLPADLPLVPIDELLIEQVFLNLLENAVKYTGAGTPIEVTAWTDEGNVVVEVSDAGSGVPPGEERAIFGKFHRAGTAPGEARVGGAGLGLTICEGIVTAHGGRIWVEPGPAGGAAFRFTLPLDGPPLGAALADLEI